MATVPSNLIPSRISQLPTDPAPSDQGWLMYIRDGVTYKVQAADILSLNGVPITRQVIAGTGLSGGGQLSSNVTLSVAAGGIGTTELASSGVTPGSYGDALSVPVLILDATGRVTSATTAPISSGGVPSSRQVIAGDGLTGGGQLTSDVTLSAALSGATPLSVDNIGAAGSSNEISRADHQHPAVDLADDNQVDGLLGLDHGGTAKSIVPQPGGVLWSGADGLYVTAAGTPGKVLASTGTGEPIWQTAVVLSDTPANQIFAGPVAGPDAEPTFRAMVNEDLPNSGATVGTYGSSTQVAQFTVNAKGVLTSASNVTVTPAFSDVSGKPTTLSGYGITDGQPLDPDLSAIAALAGTSGLLRKTGTDTWALDTASYGTVTGVTGTAPVVSSGGNAPAISMPAATSSVNGYMTSAYAGKLDGIAAGATANVGTVTSVGLTTPTGLTTSGSPITGSGTLAISLTAGYAIPTTASQTDWNTAFTDRNKWDGGATGLVAATGRTSLGATTVGSNLLTLPNPSAITFPRINADNSVSALDAASFRTATGSGTVTGVTGTAPVVSSGGSAPVISMAAASTSVNGYLTSTDWTTFNAKVAGPGSSVGGNVAVFNGSTGKVIQDGGTLGSAAFTASSAYDASGAATTAVSNHAALLTGVHGLNISAGQTLTVPTGGTIGSAAYTSSSAYDVAGAATTAVSNHAALQTGVHGVNITAGKTLSSSNSLTLAGTDGSTLNVGAGGTLGSAAFTASSAYATAIHATQHYPGGADPVNAHALHGVVSRTTIAPLPTKITTTTFTLTTGTTPLTYYNNSVQVVVNTDQSTVLSGAAGLYFIYFNSAGVLINSTTFPGLAANSGNVLIASVFWNGSNFGAVNDERHGYDRDTAWHIWAHNTVGARYGSGLTFSFAGTTNLNTTFAISSGNVYDEDINFTIPTTTVCRILRQTGATAYSLVTNSSTLPYLFSAGIQAVRSDTFALVTTNQPNRFFNVFLYGTTDVDVPVYAFVETVTPANIGGYTSVANARLAGVPSLSGYRLTPELKLLWRVVVNGAGLVQAVVAGDDYRNASVLPAGGVASSTASGVTYTPTAPDASANVQAALDNRPIQALIPIGGTANQVLGKVDGTDYNVAWQSLASGGTVTSVAMTVPTGLSIAGSPITNSGTLALTMTAGYSIPTDANQTNWSTAYTDRNKWDGGATGLTAATGRTSLGATAVGSNLFTLTNPSAVTFPRFNADNTVSALDAATFRTAIGAGTSSTTGTVTSVAQLTLGTTGTDLSSSVANGTTTPVITLNVPTASAANRGALSAADWTTFNNKQPAGSYLTSAVTTISFGTTGLTPSTATSGAVTVAGVLAIANGGTNSTATATAGGAGYGTGTAHAYTAAGTAGQVLVSNGASAPTWGSVSGGTF